MKKVDDEESNVVDVSVEMNANVDVIVEPAVIKRPAKPPKRMMQKQEEDRSKDLTAKKMVHCLKVLDRLGFEYDEEKRFID
jgi:hypothetical protein